MADFFFGARGDLIDAKSTYETSQADAERIIAHGMSRFQTQDLATVVERLAALFMGNLMADVKADEQRIAAQKASEAVPDLVATPKP